LFASKKDRQKMADKLEEIGVAALSNQIIRSFSRDFPKFSGLNFPNEYFDLFWAREYGIARERHVILIDEKLVLIITQVESKVRLDYQIDRQAQNKVEQSRLLMERQQKSDKQKEELENKLAKFRKMAVEELAEDVLDYFEQLQNEAIKSNSKAIDPYRAIESYWYTEFSERLSYFDRVDPVIEAKKREVGALVIDRWPNLVFDIEYKRMPPKEKERIKDVYDFRNKDITVLSKEVSDFFKEKEQWYSLFDHRVATRRRAFNKFWSKKYPNLTYWHNTFWEKMKSVEKSSEYCEYRPPKSIC
jgi:hypothetical protein